MMGRALIEESAAAVLFDFKAALPSVGDSSLQDALSRQGPPQWFTRFFGALYRENRCGLVIGGSRDSGFDLQLGIRQDCPHWCLLSPPTCFCVDAVGSCWSASRAHVRTIYRLHFWMSFGSFSNLRPCLRSASWYLGSA